MPILYQKVFPAKIPKNTVTIQYNLKNVSFSIHKICKKNRARRFKYKTKGRRNVTWVVLLWAKCSLLVARSLPVTHIL